MKIDEDVCGRVFSVSRLGDFQWSFEIDNMVFAAYGVDWTDALESNKTSFEQLMCVSEDKFCLSVTEGDKIVKQAIDSIIQSAGCFEITEIEHDCYPTSWAINGGIKPGQTSWKHALIACCD